MNELIQPIFKYEEVLTTKFRRLIPPMNLNIDLLGQPEEMSAKINTLNQEIKIIEKSYGFHGQSPLNDEPAPPNPATLAKHDLLSNQKYQLELTRYFTVVSSNLEPQAPPANQLIATDKIYRLSKSLSYYSLEKVRHDLGNDHYVSWLETAISAIELEGYDQPKSIDMIAIISKHLDVTEEFSGLNPLKQRFDSISAIALLGLVNTPNIMAEVVASPDR